MEAQDIIHIRSLIAEAMQGHCETHHAARSRWKPPTLDEVKEYIRLNPELGNVDPVLFWNGFNDGGWVDTRGQQVRNWKLKLRTWSSHGEPLIKKQQVRREVVYKCYHCGRQKRESEMTRHPTLISERVCMGGCRT